MNRKILTLFVLCASNVPLYADDFGLVDPMRPETFSAPEPIKSAPKVKKLVVIQKPKPLILQQTVISSQRRFAIINGFTLIEGERVKGGYRVLEINDDNVILIREDKEHVLYLAGKANIKEISR